MGLNMLLIRMAQESTGWMRPDSATIRKDTLMLGVSRIQ
jgi:hypothetical protein